MALQSQDAAANGFTSAVRDRWLSLKYMDLFTQRSPVLKMLQMRGRIQPAGYGNIMREPLMVPVTTGPQLQGVSNPYADIDPQPMTGYTSAEYPLAEYAIPVSWSFKQNKAAGGPEEMVRWKEANFKNALLRSMNTMMDHLFAAPEDPLSIGTDARLMSLLTAINGGTTAATDGGASPPAQAGQSAAPYVKATGTTAQTIVGNIQRAAVGAAYWCPVRVFSSATALTVQTLNDLYEEAFQEGEEPDFIGMPSGIFSKIQNLITVGGSSGGQRTGGPEGEHTNLGFSHVKFRNALITVDRRIPTAGFLSGTSTATNNLVLCLNLNHLTLRADGKKPKFRDVPTTKSIEQWIGDWFIALTSDHLGNVHSFSPWITT